MPSPPPDGALPFWQQMEPLLEALETDPLRGEGESDEDDNATGSEEEEENDEDGEGGLRLHGGGRGGGLRAGGAGAVRRAAKAPPLPLGPVSEVKCEAEV